MIGHQVLRSAFLDLFGRPPLFSERAAWLEAELEELLATIAAPDTPEAALFWKHWFEEQLYYFFLIDNFRPASERVLAIPAELTAGRLGVRDAIHRIALSPAFDLRNPGADTFVTVVMEQMLEITVQTERRELEIGKTLYDGGTGQFLGERGNSQADVVRIAIEDRRFLRRLLAREHRRLLRTEAATRDLKGWAKTLANEPNAFAAVVGQWVSSEAWRARLDAPIEQPNRLFVQSLFVDLTGRVPEAEEARRLREALDGLSDPGPLRSILARLILDSGEADVPARGEIEDRRRWVAELFERLLGRSASREELDAFEEALRDPECRPETVVYAIVSSPEYHQY